MTQTGMNCAQAGGAVGARGQTALGVAGLLCDATDQLTLSHIEARKNIVSKLPLFLIFTFYAFFTFINSFANYS